MVNVIHRAVLGIRISLTQGAGPATGGNVLVQDLDLSLVLTQVIPTPLKTSCPLREPILGRPFLSLVICVC